MVSVQQQITQVNVSVDSQLLNALRSYHGADADTLYLIDDEICLLRDGCHWSALTGDFLNFYDINYLNGGKK